MQLTIPVHNTTRDKPSLHRGTPTSTTLPGCVGKILVTVSKNIIHNNQSHALNYFVSKFNNFLLNKNF